VSKVPVNFRLDRDLLEGARAQAEREGITLIKLLERSLSNELGISIANDVKTSVKTHVKTSSEVIDVKTIVETAVNFVKTELEIELENVKTDLENVKAELESVKTNVKTVEAAIDVKTIVETDVNTVKTVEAANVKTTTTENESVGTSEIEPVALPQTADDSQPLEATTMSWGEFHNSIGSTTPPSKSKAAGDKAVEVASKKGLGQWRYDSNSRRFTRI
jgi:hypothetical protein